MALNNAAKAQVVKEFGRAKTDTGSPEVQIALLTSRINELTEHLKTHKHDFHSRYGLTKMVSQRRKLLRYLKSKNPKTYYQLIEKLDVRG
jgi:small subunit ribosomal protein S15